MSDAELPEELWGEKGSGRSLECGGSALVMGHTCEFEQEELIGVPPRWRDEAIALKERISELENECEEDDYEIDELRQYLREHKEERTALKAENERLRKLEEKVKIILDQKADDVCWRNAYEWMAELVGVEFKPELLPKEQFIHNCKYFYDCLASGEKYVTPEGDTK